MASGGSGGGSSSSEDPAMNYSSDFATQFSNANQKTRRPCTAETQTERCARLAAKYYSQAKEVSLTVKEANTGDSNCFEGKYIAGGDANKLYYHAMFKATVGSNKNHVLFFAELQGSSYPEEVVQCVILEEKGNVDKCKFCSSIYHPAGDFLGEIN